MSGDAEAAFGAVADELRVRILRELWDAEGALAFSELRERVDVRDSGRFNYHLGKLRGRFVEQTDDGYELRYAGQQLVSALYSGVYTEDASVGPSPVDGSCFDCGGDLEARYEDEHGHVECTDCGMNVVMGGVPPAFVDGREDDLATAIDAYLRTQIRQCTAGFCPECSGPTTGRLAVSDYGPQAIFECGRCGGEFQGTASMVALEHPAVVAFYREHGRDVREVPVWKLDWVAQPEWDGDEARVTVAVDGDELALTVDESLSVSGAERA
ncbi:winged helix-turn-helix domain-containing protein [Halobacterium sp. R2-5]|uniref:ArsR/SmtB family transcription factor n=1 Tax=Halobacterium sp. R2-5 TaxID=2715751 RepID=UPI00141E48A3|nr:winged helix-turn-helix domain-containing protein [Halobacterium sp. R2-5]NIB98187.1 helix-turn-helix transcriptional regulator [Halobacterium sp. R2-5]